MALGRLPLWALAATPVVESAVDSEKALGRLACGLFSIYKVHLTRVGAAHMRISFSFGVMIIYWQKQKYLCLPLFQFPDPDWGCRTPWLCVVLTSTGVTSGQQWCFGALSCFSLYFGCVLQEEARPLHQLSIPHP